LAALRWAIFVEIYSHFDPNDDAPSSCYFVGMAEQTDIGRGFAAVMNHPPLPAVRAFWGLEFPAASQKSLDLAQITLIPEFRPR